MVRAVGKDFAWRTWREWLMGFRASLAANPSHYRRDLVISPSGFQKMRRWSSLQGTVRRMRVDGGRWSFVGSPEIFTVEECN